MKFFATTLLASAAQAAKLNSVYQPPHKQVVIDHVQSYEKVPVTRYRQEPRTTYEIQQEIRQRQIPTTVYDTVQETLYRDVERTEYRKVPETVYDDVLFDRRIVHEHISDPDDYDSSDYKNSHSHDSQLEFGIGLGLSSDYSEELYYGDSLRDGPSSDYSYLTTSLTTDISHSNSKFHSDSDHYRERGVRRHVYAIDASSGYFSSESSQYDYYQDSYPSRSRNSGSDVHSDAESFTQWGDRAYLPNRYSRNVTGEVYERVAGGDSYSSDSLDESVDLHYHRYTDVRQEPRTIYVDEPYTVIDQVPYTVDRTIPREVLITEDFAVDVKVPVTNYVSVPYTEYEKRPVIEEVERVVKLGHGKRGRRHH